MVGLDVTHKALLYPQKVDELRGAGRVGGLVASLYDFYHGHHQRMYGWAGSPCTTPSQSRTCLGDRFLETQHRYVEVDVGPEPGRGRTYVDLWERTGKDANCRVGVDVDGPGFIDVLVDRLKSLK
jgi:inosine-uridine nucleoside N-ribohydrolase